MLFDDDDDDGDSHVFCGAAAFTGPPVVGPGTRGPQPVIPAIDLRYFYLHAVHRYLYSHTLCPRDLRDCLFPTAVVTPQYRAPRFDIAE